MSIGNAFALIRAAEEHNAECARCAIVMPVPPAPAADAVYTDGVHMAAVDVELLHATARRVGLRREWFQEGGTQFRGRGPIVSRDHYDMTTTRTYHRARSVGVAFVPWRDFARLFPPPDRVRFGSFPHGSEVSGVSAVSEVPGVDPGFPGFSGFPLPESGPKC